MELPYQFIITITLITLSLTSFYTFYLAFASPILHVCILLALPHFNFMRVFKLGGGEFTSRSPFFTRLHRIIKNRISTSRYSTWIPLQSLDVLYKSYLDTFDKVNLNRETSRHHCEPSLI